MSQVNKSIYPDRTTALSGMQLTSTQLADLSLDTEWETSIAVSQSTSENAAYNRVTYITIKDDVFPPVYDETERRSPVQQIALYYSQNLVNMAATQYYNGSVTYSGQSFNISQLNDAPYNFYSMRRSPASAWTADVVNALQSRYNKRASFLITGADFQKLLCVVCVGFTNGNYCSLKYYEDHKNDLSLTPSHLFMIGLIDNDGGASLQTCCPINLSSFTYHFWQKDSQTGVISNNDGQMQFLFPAPVLRTMAYIAGSRNVGSTQTGTLGFPLVACMGGGTLNANNYWTSKPAAGSPIFGGECGYHYTLHVDGSTVYTHLSQYGFDIALKAAACYGLPFTIDFPTGLTDFYSDPTINTYIPIANEGGYFNGNFEPLTIAGILNPEISAVNLQVWTGGKDAPYNDRDYDPNIPVPVEEIELTHPTITPIGSFNQTYILNKSEVDSIQDYIYGADDTTLENFLKGISNFGGSPMDAFISLHMWPFDVRDFVSGSNTAKLVVGRTTISDGGGDVIGYVMPPDANGIIDCGHFHIDEVFESFLDYEPYTTINLFIPFIGSVDLAPSLYMGKTVSVKIICDWITGAMTGVVYADGIPLVYQQGIGAVSLSMTGDNHSRTAGDVLGGLIGAGASAVGAVASAKTGNLGAALNFGTKAAEMAASAWNDYGRTDFNQAGSSSPMCSLYMPMYCYITISRPKLLYDDDMMAAFAEGVGFADSRISSLAAEGSSGSGIVVGAPVRVSFSSAVQPTPSEIDSILQALSTGVFPA